MEKEQLFFYTPKEALMKFQEKGMRGILFSADKNAQSPQEELFILDAENKAAEYLTKDYSSNKTLEKISMNLSFKQFAYLVMSDHEMVQKMEEEKVRKALRILASRRADHLTLAKSDILRNVPQERRARNEFFIKREIDALDELGASLGSQGVQVPSSMEENPLPKRARR